VACCVVLWVFVLSLRNSDKTKLTTYSETRTSLIVCTSFLIALAFINFMGILTFWWGRFVYTSMIALMYMFTITTLVADTLGLYMFSSREKVKAYESELLDEIESDEEITIESDKVILKYLKDLLIKYADTAYTPTYYGSLHIEEENEIPLDDSPEAQSKFKSNLWAYHLNQFRIVVKDQSWIKVEDQDKSDQHFAMPGNLRPMTKRKLYAPAKIIRLFISLLELRELPASQPGAVFEKCRNIVTQHFIIEDDIMEQISKDPDRPVPAKVHNNIRMSHTIPLSSDTTISLYQQIITGRTPAMHRIYGLTAAVLEKLWFSEFMQLDAVQRAINEYFNDHGIKNVVFVDKRISKTTYDNTKILSKVQTYHFDDGHPQTDVEIRVLDELNNPDNLELYYNGTNPFSDHVS
jgi:hypothetical protein